MRPSFEKDQPGLCQSITTNPNTSLKLQWSHPQVQSYRPVYHVQNHPVCPEPGNTVNQKYFRTEFNQVEPETEVRKQVNPEARSKIPQWPYQDDTDTCKPVYPEWRPVTSKAGNTLKWPHQESDSIKQGHPDWKSAPEVEDDESSDSEVEEILSKSPEPEIQKEKEYLDLRQVSILKLIALIVKRMRLLPRMSTENAIVNGPN